MLRFILLFFLPSLIPNQVYATDFSGNNDNCHNVQQLSEYSGNLTPMDTSDDLVIALNHIQDNHDDSDGSRDADLLSLPEELLLGVLEKMQNPMQASLVCRQFEHVLTDCRVNYILTFKKVEDFRVYVANTRFPKSGLRLNFPFDFASFTTLTSKTNQISYLDLQNNGINDDTLSAILPELPALRTINLSRNPITDTRGLGSIHTVNLSFCRNIQDFSALGSNHTLDLSFTNIQDARHLGKVYSLNLMQTRVVDVTALRNVPILNLCLTAVEDVSNLGSHQHLNLSNTKIRSVQGLSAVLKLDLSGSVYFTDIRPLAFVEELNLSQTRVTDVTALTHVKKLVFWGDDIPTSSLQALQTINPGIQISARVFNRFFN